VEQTSSGLERQFIHVSIVTLLRLFIIILNNVPNTHIRSVCSPTVRIIAFQAIDPGSTPGRRSHFLYFKKMNLLFKGLVAKRTLNYQLPAAQPLFPFGQTNFFGFAQFFFFSRFFS
jgi:hypothetical protein